MEFYLNDFLGTVLNMNNCHHWEWALFFDCFQRTSQWNNMVSQRYQLKNGL